MLWLREGLGSVGRGKGEGGRRWGVKGELFMARDAGFDFQFPSSHNLLLDIQPIRLNSAIIEEIWLVNNVRGHSSNLLRD